MKKMNRYTMGLLLMFLFLVGCTAEPKPVPYGEANCAHCNMTVSDERFGAELLNDKGKAYFFDSAECLAAYVAEQPELGKSAAFLLVTDFTNPSKLIEAKSAYFLQSEALQSPMGMNLTAMADELTAIQMKQKVGGSVLRWDQVVSAVKNDAKFR